MKWLQVFAVEIRKHWNVCRQVYSRSCQHCNHVCVTNSYGEKNIDELGRRLISLLLRNYLLEPSDFSLVTYRCRCHWYQNDRLLIQSNKNISKVRTLSEYFYTEMLTFSLLLLLSSVLSFIIMPIQVTEASGNADAELPLYYGWFVETEYSSSFLNIGHKMLADTLQEIPDFLKDVQNFTQQTYITDILLHYKRENADEVLHCTAMYNGVYPNYVPGAQQYSEKQVVKDNLNQVSTLHSIGWILTPRTFGSRIKLTNNQLLLWNQNDTEGNPKHLELNSKTLRPSVTYGQNLRLYKENSADQDPDVMGNFQPTSGNGSKAHLTLGCAPGVAAVTTGYDLVDLIRLEGINGSEVKTYDVPKGGWLRNYGEGQWVFYPTKQFLLESTFLGYDSGTRQLAASFSLLCLSCAFAILAMFKQKL